jgi:hypothetical protein
MNIAPCSHFAPGLDRLGALGDSISLRTTPGLD